ncbi:MAG: hypothetical protein HQK54_09120, partial [Oligoflexales bacterium]|nr:hypothetical protein [Oligoflexales bacterium]
FFGCGPEGGTGTGRESSLVKSNLKELINKGRSVALTPLGEMNYLTLQSSIESSSIVDTKMESGSNVIGWQLYDTDKMERVAETEVEKYMYDFMMTNRSSFGFSISDIKIAKMHKIEPTEKLIAYFFTRSFNEIPVRDAFVELIFLRQDDGNLTLREVINRSYGNIKIKEENIAITPSSFADLMDAVGDSKITYASDKRFILPRENNESGYDFYYATEFNFTDEYGDLITVTLDDSEKKVLEAYAHKTHIQDYTLKANVYKTNYLETKMDSLIPLTDYKVGNASYKTDKDGHLTVESGQTIALSLQSTRVNVSEYYQNGVYTVNIPIDKDNPVIYKPTDKEIPALNVYTLIHRVNRFIRNFLSDSDSSYLGKSTSFIVNRNDEACNAYYNDQNNSINLYAAGSSNGTNCANMATINDVPAHEWGHGLNNYTGPGSPGISDGAGSEGFSDTVASYYGGYSDMGKGFKLNDNNPVRSVKNTAKVGSTGSEVHAEGQIISGVFWDMREALIERYGEIKGKYLAGYLFFRHLTLNKAYKDSYKTVLTLDDDDGNPSTKSPNYCLITKAFANHGLATDDGCTDNIVKDTVPVNQNIYAGINSQDDKGAILMIAIDKGSAVQVCLGDRKKCTGNTGTVDVTFAKEGEAGGKTFFLAQKPVTIKDLSLFTVLVQSDTGGIISARTLKFVTK